MRNSYLSGADITIIALIVVVMIAAIFVPPYFEARTFNRCTGGHATYLDALTAELRVMECKVP